MVFAPETECWTPMHKAMMGVSVVYIVVIILGLKHKVRLAMAGADVGCRCDVKGPRSRCGSSCARTRSTTRSTAPTP
eukprot:3670493-Rhodomonas_salina.1